MSTDIKKINKLTTENITSKIITGILTNIELHLSLLNFRKLENIRMGPKPNKYKREFGVCQSPKMVKFDALLLF